MVEKWFSVSLVSLPSTQRPIRSKSSTSSSNKQRSSTTSNASGQASGAVSTDRTRVNLSKKNLWKENVPNNRGSTNTSTSRGRKSKASSFWLTSTSHSEWVEHHWRTCVFFFNRELGVRCSYVICWDQGISMPTSGEEPGDPIKV